MVPPADRAAQTPVPRPEQGPPLIDPRPPRPAEREPDIYPPRAPVEDPPATPPDPGEPVPEIEDPPRPTEAPGDPVVT